MRGLVSLTLLALAAGCTAEAARWDAPNGRWKMVSTETSRSCTAFAELLPFTGGDITLTERGGAMRWYPAIGVPVRYKPSGDRTYKRQVDTLYQGCKINAEAYLTIDEVTDEKLDGTYHVTYTRKTGSDRCVSLPDRCELAFKVEGAAADSSK
jgi:hypothetical protein